MNILFVLEYYWPHTGGVEVMFQNLAEGLAKEGHHVQVLTQRLPDTKAKENRNGVHIHRIWSPSRYFFTFLAVPAAIDKASRADVVHTTTFNGAPPAWLAAKLLGKKVVLTVHEVWINFWSQLGDMNLLSRIMHDMLERFLYMLPFDKYVCVSKSTARQLSRVGIKKKRISVVYNGVDYKHFAPRKSKKNKVFTVLSYSRPGVSKGIEYLVDAMGKVKGEIQLVLLLSQDKAYKARYRKIRAQVAAQPPGKIQLRKSVSWHELPKVISEADAVCVPSLSEGFGYSAAQAVAMGKPVIASNTTSLPEVVSGKYLLVPPRDSTALARAFEQAKKGKYEKKKVRKFTVADNVKGYVSVYKDLKIRKKK